MSNLQVEIYQLNFRYSKVDQDVLKHKYAHTWPKLTSIIVCSIDDDKFSKFKQNTERTFSGQVQLIRIIGATSIAEGYNRGIENASGEILIFCHDDIEFLNNNVSEILREDLCTFDIVGVAGTSRLIEGTWISAGQPYVHGMVAHTIGSNLEAYNLCCYGLGRDACIVAGIQALDGLFIAVNSSIIEKIKFDEALFNGFHLYDLDFTFSAYLKGFRICVDQRIHLVHQSGGRYDSVWKKYAEKFNKKYCTVLTTNTGARCNFIRTKSSHSRERIKDEMQFCLRGHRVLIEQLENNSNGASISINWKNTGKHCIVNKNDGEFPFSDSSVSYIRYQYKKPSMKRISENIPEILRTCRRGAMVELLGPADVKSSARGYPEIIRFRRGENQWEYLNLQFDMKDSGAANRAIYQVEKNDRVS